MAIPPFRSRPIEPLKPVAPPSAAVTPQETPQPSGLANVAFAPEPEIEEENLYPPLAVFTPEVQPKAPVKKPDKPEIPSKPVKAPEPSSTNLQKARGPRADDRLLDLVDKDINRAIDQPIERRRLQFSKEVVQNPRVRHFINYFSRNQKQYFAQALARSGKYFPMIAKVLREQGLPEELAYLALIESEFSPLAVSPSGAAGLWQFVPGTARKYGLTIDSWVDERRDPVKSTRAAAAYLNDLHNYFGRWYLATAAYNAGPGAIDRAMQKSRAKDFWSLAEKAKLREETRDFVPKFVAAALIATEPKKYGLGHIVYESPLQYEEVEVHGHLQLASLAEMAGTDTKVIRELNPALLRDHVPPGENGFALKLPAGQAHLFALAYSEARDSQETRFVTHQVKKGETLFSIARRYGQQVRALMELNGLTDSRLRIGQQLRVLLDGLRGTLR